MTGEQLTEALLKYAKEIAPGATVIVFAVAKPDDSDDESLGMVNASPYDLSTVAHLVTDWILEDMTDMLDELNTLKAQSRADKPS